VVDAVDRLLDQVARIPTVRSETSVFVRMEGVFAIVNVGPQSAIKVPCVGWYPPVAGMTVQVEWRDGHPVVTGPARSLSPIGTISAPGTPKATVLVDGIEYLLYTRQGYEAVLGDMVTVNWQTGIIEGAITGVDTPEEPDTGGVAAAQFTDLPVLAENSGSYQSRWWKNDVWASSNNDGLWTYGWRTRDALAGADVTKVEIFLPLQSEVGNAQIGLSPNHVIPPGAPTITDLVDLPVRSGWVALPSWWGNWLRDNTGGIGVLAPGGGGYTRWTGTALDSWSGALRFAGNR
jgi:hypothetical protein